MSNNKSFFENKFGAKKNPKVEKAKDSKLAKQMNKQYHTKDKWELQDTFEANKRKGKNDFRDKNEGGFDRKPKFDGDRKFDKKFDKKDGFKPRREGSEGGFDRKPRFDGERKFDKKDGFKPRREGGEGGYDRKPRFDGERKFDKKFDKKDGFKPRRDNDEGGYDRKPRFDGERKFDKKFDKKDGFKPRREGSEDGYDRKPRFDGERKFDKKFDKKDGFKFKGGKRDEKDTPKKFGANIFAKDKKEKEVFYTEEDRTRLFGEEAFKDRVLKELEEEIENDLTQDKKDKAFKKKQEARAKREKRRGDDDYEMTKYIDDEEDYEIVYEASGGRKWSAEHAMDNNYRRPPGEEEEMPLNKFVAYCGICSRRDAVEIIKSGKINIDGNVCKEPGFKVTPSMHVTLDGKRITVQKNLVYILMNKPKGYITTTDDPKDRKTVMDLVVNHIDERVFPVGRLDRNTTGLLLLTNDGELAQQLAHPKYEIRKIYHVVLDKNLSKPDFDKIINGVELEDGIAPVDHLAYLESKNEIGIEIHSGKNRIVRRIFESLGYVVEKLDRVMYAGLTKKNVPRGKWRMLNKQEIINLKHLGKK